MRKKYRLLSLALSLAMVFGLIIADTAAVSAKNYWNLIINPTVYVGEPWGGLGLWNEKSEEEAEIVSLTSSAPGKLQIKKFTGEGDEGQTTCEWAAYPKKPGKVTLSVKYKTASGKTGSFTQKVTVKKYPNQIKSLKINGKKVNVKKNKYNYNEENFKADKVTINLKLKKGWKITDVQCYVEDRDTEDYQTKTIKNAKKLLKAGKPISYHRSYESFWMYITMQKGNDIISYGIQLDRPYRD